MNVLTVPYDVQIVVDPSGARWLHYLFHRNHSAFTILLQETCLGHGHCCRWIEHRRDDHVSLFSLSVDQAGLSNYSSNPWRYAVVCVGVASFFIKPLIPFSGPVLVKHDTEFAAEAEDKEEGSFPKKA